MVSLGIPSGTTIANNSAFSYPVLLGGEWCDPFTLYQCSNGKGPFDPCCVSLQNDAMPYETVSNTALGVISTIIPMSLILIRWALLSRWLKHDDVRLVDALFGYAFSVIVTMITTEIIKTSIGYPRPNHFAMVLVGSNTKHVGLADEAYKSFPSGHASLSMASLLFVTLLFLHDVRRKTSSPSHATFLVRSILLLVAFIPCFIAIFIAMTRLRDYWHSPVDVVMGMLLGGVWAVFSFLGITL